MKISLDIVVTPKTACHDSQILDLLSKLPDVTKDNGDGSGLKDFVPFGAQALEFSIGRGDKALLVDADDQHISIQGELDTSSPLYVGQLKRLLSEIVDASKHYKGDVPQGHVEKVDNPFAS